MKTTNRQNKQQHNYLDFVNIVRVKSINRTDTLNDE